MKHSEQLLLETLNRLRILETRRTVDYLPVQYCVEDKTREAFLREWNRQINIHQYNVTACVEYTNRIILTRSEVTLIRRNNKTPRGDPRQFYLTYKEVCGEDRILYCPNPPASEDTYVFISYINHTEIKDISVVRRHNQIYYIAKHCLADSTSFTPGPASLKFHSDLESDKSQSSKPQSSGSSVVSDSVKRSPLQRAKRKLSISAITRSVREWRRNRMARRDEKSNSSPPPEGAEDTKNPYAKLMEQTEFKQQFNETLSGMLQNYMGRRVLRSGRFTPLHPPEFGEDIDSERRVENIERENARLVEELGTLKSQQTPSARPVALTEQQQVLALKTDMASMAKVIQSLQTELGNKLTAEEVLKLQKLSEPAAALPSLIYTLSFPENIVPVDEFRAPLSILKAQAVVATIGTFDPDISPKSDFRDIWDRIQNYTRNYRLYEHEYVDVLMAVMKGSAATCLNDMIREFKGDLRQILEAIQDIYVPQHTVFDDVDDLNKFVRPRGENIRTTMRRASLIVYKLRNQCAPAAWEERRYHMLLALLKQVIDRQTFRHLHGKELECAQAGTQLDLKAIVDIIALYEQTHDLLPKLDMKLMYNISTMQLVNQPINGLTELEEIKLELRKIMSLTVQDRPSRNQERQTGTSAQRAASKELIKTPPPRYTQSPARMPERGRSQSPNQYRERRENSDRSSQPMYSQRRSDGRRDYRSPSPYPNKNSDQRDQQRSNSSSGSRDYKNKDRRQGNRDNRNKDKKNYDQKDGKPYTKTFSNGKNTVTLNFYKCKMCPSLHPQGDECLTQSYVTQSQPLNN